MSEINIQDFYSKLKYHFDNSNRSQIESFLRDSFFQTKTISNKKAIISVGNEYASFLRVIGDTNKSYEVYYEIESLIKEIFGEKSKEYASYLLNLGDVDIVSKNYNKALENFNKAELVLEQYTNEKFLLATLYNNRSSAYRNVGENKLAIKDIRSALALVKDKPNKMAISLINLAEIYILEGDFDKAKDKINEAIKIFKKLEKKDDIHYANALATAGQIYYYLGDYDKSHAYYVCSLDLLNRKASNSKVTDILKANIEKVKKLKKV